MALQGWDPNRHYCGTINFDTLSVAYLPLSLQPALHFLGMDTKSKSDARRRSIFSHNSWRNKPREFDEYNIPLAVRVLKHLSRLNPVRLWRTSHSMVPRAFPGAATEWTLSEWRSRQSLSEKEGFENRKL
jgi:hypothetical protein